MNAKVPYKIIDRNELIEYITEEIEKSPNKEFELSVTDLAKKYDVQGPTMDYHMKKLLDDKVFEVSKKKGKYSRKILILPGSEKEDSSSPVINNMSSFKELIQKKINSGELKINKQKNTIDEEDDVVLESTGSEELEQTVEDVKQTTEEDNNDIINIPFNLDKIDEEKPYEIEIIDADHNTEDVFDTPTLSLDYKIKQFLEESSKIPTANQLISRQDKEVISVMTESIQQHMVYLKDLMDTLKLVETLNMVRDLIDERNKMLEEMKQMREEHKTLVSSIYNEGNQVNVDPQRVRLMHQIIINTVDTYLDQPNHSLALQRLEFRESITKEVSDLANYILGIEK